MKRTLAAAVLFAVLAAPGFSQQVSFKFSAGWTTVQGDDYKTAAAGLNRFLRDSYGSVQGDYHALTNGGLFQAEIMTHWGKRLAVGLGGGFYQIKKSESILAALGGADGTVATETAFVPGLTAIPFFLNVHYKMSLGNKLGLDVIGGPVFQITQFTAERNALSTADPLGEVEAFKASVPTLGLQAGISLSLRVGAGISLVADGLYRYGKAFNFVGNWTYFGTFTTGTTTGTSSTYYLWLYDHTGPKGTYPLIGYYDENGPTGAGTSNVRKAEFNISGFTFTAGIKIDL